MKYRETVYIILFFMTLGQLATDIYLPSFPSMARELHTSINTIQLSFSVFLASFGVSQLFYGPLIERFGRKPWLLIGISLYSVMSIAASFVTSVEQLLVIRTIQGLGAGAMSVIPRAIMRDVFSDKQIEKLAVYQSLIWSLIPILAPLIGSYIQHYLGWRSNFIFLFIISSIAFVFALRYSETLADVDVRLKVKQIAGSYAALLKNKQFYTPLICAVGTVSLLTVFNVSSPIILQQHLGLSALQYGWTLVVISSAFMLGIIINRVLMRFMPNPSIKTMGGILIIVASNLFLFANLFYVDNFYALLAPIVLLQLGSAFIFPGSAAKAMNAVPANGGISASVFGSSLFLGGTLVSSLVAAFPHSSLLPIASLMLAISVVILIFHNFLGVNHESHR